MPWYPASVNENHDGLCRAKSVKEGHLTLESLLTVSPVAASQSPSKMGFRPACRSPSKRAGDDDGEVGQRYGRVLAEGVGGSSTAFRRS